MTPTALVQVTGCGGHVGIGVSVAIGAGVNVAVGVGVNVAIGVARQTVEAHGALAAREHLIARRNPPGDDDRVPYHRAAKAGPRNVQ